MKMKKEQIKNLAELEASTVNFSFENNDFTTALNTLIDVLSHQKKTLNKKYYMYFFKELFDHIESDNIKIILMNELSNCTLCNKNLGI
jgi:hypothetical protein